MTEKTKYPLALAAALAAKIADVFRPCCERLEIAGSIRRRRPLVGDIEILYIPALTQVPDPNDLFGSVQITVNAVDAQLDALIKDGSLARRPKSDGTHTWGEHIKLATAVKTGIPVDFFAATRANWFNLLVCRTGPKDLNIRLASTAQRNDMNWEPYSAGFITQPNALGQRYLRSARSERDVFALAGVPYLEPHER